MRIILKILAAPFVLLLSLVLGVLTLLHTLTTGVLSILTLIAAACGLFACTIGGDPASGIRVLIVAALISPFGLPALSEWMILKLGDLKYALRAICWADTSGQIVPKQKGGGSISHRHIFRKEDCLRPQHT